MVINLCLFLFFLGELFSKIPKETKLEKNIVKFILYYFLYNEQTKVYDNSKVIHSRIPRLCYSRGLGLKVFSVLFVTNYVKTNFMT